MRFWKAEGSAGVPPGRERSARIDGPAALEQDRTVFTTKGLASTKLLTCT